MDITLDLPFLNIHNLFTNERISVYLDEHNRMFFNTKDYNVIQKTPLVDGRDNSSLQVMSIFKQGYFPYKLLILYFYFAPFAPQVNFSSKYHCRWSLTEIIP